MRIYSKSGEQIGVQDKAGKNYFFTREMNAFPPKDFIVSMQATSWSDASIIMAKQGPAHLFLISNP